MMNADKALITGGAGFVGHHLARLLLDNDYEVLVVDNFSTGTLENLVELQGQPGFSLKAIDLTDQEATAAAVTAFQPDAVFHLAAIHFIPYCNAHPTETMRVNVLGTQHVLEAVRNTSSVGRFIYASTAAIYQPQDEPNVEETTPVGIFDVYGLSKLSGENLIKYYRKICPEITFINARLFNVYGPGETNPHVLPEILGCMAESDTLSLGDLKPKRDYVYVKNVAEALWALAEGQVPSTEVNVATGKEYSVQELIDCISELTGRSLTVTQDSAKLRPSERQHLLGDNSKIAELVGWTPRTSLREGLRELLVHEGLAEQRQPTGRVAVGKGV